VAWQRSQPHEGEREASSILNETFIGILLNLWTSGSKSSSKLEEINAKGNGLQWDTLPKFLLPANIAL
jgi:hypothetical protein